MYVCEVAQSCPTLCDPMDCSLPGYLVRGIYQARVLDWVAISFSRGSSQPRDQTRVSRTAGRCFTVWATRRHRLVLTSEIHSIIVAGFIPWLKFCLLLWLSLGNFGGQENFLISFSPVFIREILVPRLGIELVIPALEVWRLNKRNIREVQKIHFYGQGQSKYY